MQSEISGFWRRIGAFIIDSIILGVLGLFLGLLFSQQFVELGGWGRAVGFPIAAIYFAILNSGIGGGQTIGKKVLKIMVVGKAGNLINLPQSALRYSVLGIPFFLNGALIPESIIFSFGFYLLSLLVFGFGFSIVYLYTFNRNTRQSLHDIIAGTYVVRKNTATENRKQVWRVHYAICGILMVLSLFAPIFIGQLSQNDFFSALAMTRAQIQSVPQVVHATIQDGKSTFSPINGESRTTTYLTSQVFIKSQNIEDEKFASKIANIILETQKDAIQKNLIRVILTYGYDIGIASRWNSHHYSFTPKYWLENKGESDPAR